MTEKSALEAVILDWAGTVVDHGSRAPMGAFVRAFGEFGVTISVADARGPMGLAKREHIKAVASLPSVASAWRARHGRKPNEADIEAIFSKFEPMNIASVRDHAELIPGAVAALKSLHSRGLRLGSTTGYTRHIMDELAPIAAKAGFKPEIIVCADELPAGRPSPLMMWYAMARMGVWPAATVVKVDDTPPGIGEGIAAGTWTVGVALSGNIVGLSAEELNALSDADRSSLRSRASRELTEAGAHLVIDSIADLPNAIDTIATHMAAGGRPNGG